ncbi:MAG: PCRF domain-containing protein, partial [Anaerolineales bacterium]
MKDYKRATRKFKIYWSVFDLIQKQARLEEFRKVSEDPQLWEDPERAQKVMKQISALNQEVTDWKMLYQQIQDSLELANLWDENLRAELELETKEIEDQIRRREFTAMLSGEYDRGNAILAIHAGAGGTDS